MLHYWHQKLFSLCLILTWTAAELPRDSRLLPRPHNILAVDVVVFMYTCHSQRSLPLPSHSQEKENAPTGISVKFNEFTDSDVGATLHHFVWPPWSQYGCVHCPHLWCCTSALMNWSFAYIFIQKSQSPSFYINASSFISHSVLKLFPGKCFTIQWGKQSFCWLVHSQSVTKREGRFRSATESLHLL